MKTEEERYEAALAYAAQKHVGQYRIGGEPYLSHPVAVAALVREWGLGLDGQITALFHDLLEDTDAEEAEIERLGGPAVLEAVKCLTKRKGYVMEEYVAGIRANPMAKAVKAADRLHNLRCALCTNTEFKRRYIYESLDWYLDFSPQIPPAVKALAESLETPLIELPFLYEPVDTWKLGRAQTRAAYGNAQ